MTQVRRRHLVLAAGAVLLSPAALSQPTRKEARIGFLSNLSPESGKQLTQCFLRGLRDLGWIEHETLKVEYRSAEGKADRFPPLAAELVRLSPDVIVVMSTPGAQAVHRATTKIPVVFMGVSDPVTSGIVASLARPGGNVTGVSNFLPATSGKLLELLKTAAPGVSTVGVLYNPSNPGKVLELHELETAAHAMRIAIVPLEVRSSKDFDGAFSKARQVRCDGLTALQEGLTLANRSQIANFAGAHQLPTVFQIREFVEAGGLMSYGLNYCQHFQSAAAYVDKILRGTPPSDLPIELPTTFELLINTRTAERIGLKLPQSLLARADEVIK